MFDVTQISASICFSPTRSGCLTVNVQNRAQIVEKNIFRLYKRVTRLECFVSLYSDTCRTFEITDEIHPESWMIIRNYG